MSGYPECVQEAPMVKDTKHAATIVYSPLEKCSLGKYIKARVRLQSEGCGTLDSL